MTRQCLYDTRKGARCKNRLSHKSILRHYYYCHAHVDRAEQKFREARPYMPQIVKEVRDTFTDSAW